MIPRGLSGLVTVALSIGLPLTGVAGCGREGTRPPAHPAILRAPRRVGAGEARSASALAPARPRIVQWRIPYGFGRRREMARYAQRHYGIDTWRLIRPRVIVEHYTDTTTALAAYSTFAPDRPDAELHELPNTCAHFLVARDGTIYQLVPLTVMCRHTVGLNYTSIGIEHVGESDRDVLTDRRELGASLALTRWLRCRYHIPIADVIGHHESLRSPFHRERVARLRQQTHGDMATPAMTIYRRRLEALPCRGM